MMTRERRSSYKIKLLNIDFYDYFIICLFLFYDRFYRSFDFYDFPPSLGRFSFFSVQLLQLFSYACLVFADFKPNLLNTFQRIFFLLTLSTCDNFYRNFFSRFTFFLGKIFFRDFSLAFLRAQICVVEGKMVKILANFRLCKFN